MTNHETMLSLQSYSWLQTYSWHRPQVHWELKTEGSLTDSFLLKWLNRYFPGKIKDHLIQGHPQQPRTVSRPWKIIRTSNFKNIMRSLSWKRDFKSPIEFQTDLSMYEAVTRKFWVSQITLNRLEWRLDFRWK